MFDLTNCDKEPIHIPGKIQSHGFLISMDTSFSITHCSENVAAFLPVSAARLLNQSVQVLDNFFQKENGPDFIIRVIKSAEKNNGLEPSNPYAININEKTFNLVISLSNDLYLLEFEPGISGPEWDLNSIVSRSISAMLANLRLSPLLAKSAEEIRKIIGYDRVMIYKFHEDGHGEVVAEDKNEALSPLMGLHYPASDIPKQARELYKINLVRLIGDVNKEPSDIIAINQIPAAPLDLTNSVLRAVSPLHIQYLKNMNVVSSFSISLLHHDELWGLVACHNNSPRFIGFKERESAALIGKILSSTLSYQQEEEDQQKINKLKIAVETLGKQLLQYDTIENALFRHEVTLLDAVSATGAILVNGKKIHSCGKIPDLNFLEQLVDWLNENMHDLVYFTSKLPVEFQPAQKYKEFSSGLLAIRLSKELNNYIIWLRPEVISNINWAGNPDKPVEFNTEGRLQISPRKSFEKWAQTILNTSLVWGNEDIRSALYLRDEVAFAILKKAAEIRQLNEKLNEAYNELDAFSHTIAHDLKNPLATISAYSQMLTADFDLDPKARTMVAGIVSGTGKMQRMIEHILKYSQIGQAKIQHKEINMHELLNEIRNEFLVANQNTELQITINNTPGIYGDETMGFQVFSNLVANAVKYSSKKRKPMISINGKDTGAAVQYSISDNGIGIKPSERETIFELFRRSDEAKDYEGSGVGLAIVKKIMDKHNGQIWIESDAETGSTFYVSFNKKEGLKYKG